MKAIVADTDIVSIFAKIDEFKTLKKLFPDRKICIVPAVVTELKIIENQGFEWVKKVFENTDVLDLRRDELKRYEHISGDIIHLGPGEIQSIISCETRGYVLLTNDKRAASYAISKGLRVLDLATLLFALRSRGICSKKELGEIIKRIEDKDYLVIKGKEKLIK